MSSKSDLPPRERLKRLREHLDYSQRDLADVFGVAPGALAMWESGAREIPGPALVVLDRLETDFNLRDIPNPEPALDEYHLSRRYSESVLANAGFKPGSNQNSLTQHSVREAMLELVRKYLSPIQLTRRIQVSLIDKLIAGMADVKGLPLKLLQLVSFVDLGLSDRTRATLTEIQASLSPMPTKHLRQVFTEEFGRSPEDMFMDWNPSPFAIASIGQVHEARLPSGERIAVKVQYPNIFRKIVVQSQPVRMLSYLSALFRSDYKDMLRDFVEKLQNECDYRVEAEHQESMRRAFESDPQIVVPRVFPDHSGARVLTSEYIDAKDFRTFCATASQEEKNLAGGIIHRFQYESTMNHGLVQGDVHPGNYLFLDGKVACIDFGRALKLKPSSRAATFEYYKAVHANDPVAARAIMESHGYVHNWSRFDFDEYWGILREQMKYELSGESVKFDRAYVRNIFRLGNSFRDRSRLVMGPEFFWPIFTSIHLWNLLAELEAEYVWRKNVPF